MPQSKFSEETKKEIIARYRRGVKVSQLCEDYVVPQSTLYKWLHESTTYLRRYSRLPVSNHQNLLWRRLMMHSIQENTPQI